MGGQMTTLFLLAFTVWLFAVTRRVRGSDGAPSFRLNILITVVPVVLATALLFATSGAAAELRARLVGIRYLVEPSAAGLDLTIGGDDEIVAGLDEGRTARPADLYVPRVPTNFGRLRAGQLRNGEWQIRIGYANAVAPGGTRGAIIVGDNQHDWSIVGSVALQIGDQIEFSGSARSGRIQIRDGGQLEVHLTGPVAAQRTVVLSRLQVAIPIIERRYTVFKRLNSAQRTHSLEGISRHAVGENAADGPDGMSSFFYFNTDPFGWTGQLHLAVLDPDVRVIRGGNTLAAPVEEVLAEGARIRFAGLGRTSPALPHPYDRTGVRDFRSAVISLHREQQAVTALALTFDKPEVLSFTPAQLAALEGDEADREDGRQLAMSLVPNTITDRSIAFSGLSDRFVAGGEAAIDLKQPGRAALLTPAGALEAPFGEGVWLGDSAQALVQFDAITPRRTLGVALILLAFMNAMLLRAAGVTDRRALLLMAVASGLVAFRCLLGFKAFNQPPADSKSLGLAIVALAAVPWVLVTIWSRRAAPLGLGLLTAHMASAMVIFLITRVMLSGAAAAAVLGAIVLAAIPVWFASVPTSAARRFGSVGDRVGSAVAGVRLAGRALLHVLRLDRGSVFGAFWLAVALSVLLLVFRLAGMAVGVRERLPIPGVPFAVSVIFTPMLLFAYAIVVSRWHQRGFRPAWGWGLSFGVFSAVSCLFVGFAVSDLGIPLLFGVVLLWDAALVTKHAFNLRRITVLAAVATMLFVPLVFVSWTLRQKAEVIRAAEGAEQLPSGRDRNWLRLLHSFYPETLDKIGTRDSDNLAIMHQVLNRYQQSGLTGAGYPHGEVTTVLGPTVLREHVPAVYLLADFGHFGMALLAILYLMPLWSFRHGLFEVSGDVAGTLLAAHFGTLCFTAFGLCSVYMLLANYNVLPFTGKNAYLLGLDSIGDLFEATLLLALGAAARLHARRVVASVAEDVNRISVVQM